MEKTPYEQQLQIKLLNRDLLGVAAYLIPKDVSPAIWYELNIGGGQIVHQNTRRQIRKNQRKR